MDLFFFFLLAVFSLLLIVEVRRGRTKHARIAAAGAMLSATDVLLTSISLPPLVITVILFSVILVGLAMLSR
jgi:hypothetical protein